MMKITAVPSTKPNNEPEVKNGFRAETSFPITCEPW